MELKHSDKGEHKMCHDPDMRLELENINDITVKDVVVTLIAYAATVAVLYAAFSEVAAWLT